MKIIAKKLLLVIFFISLSGCTESELIAPCPNYGQSCIKKPINSWNYYGENY